MQLKSKLQYSTDRSKKVYEKSN